MIKVKKRKILLLPGDGIGPEVIGEVKKIINWFNDTLSRFENPTVICPIRWFFCTRAIPN